MTRTPQSRKPSHFVYPIFEPTPPDNRDSEYFFHPTSIIVVPLTSYRNPLTVAS